MTHFKQYKPFMAYLEPTEIDKLKKFSKQTKLPMAQIVREAISQRMANGDPYQSGFNAGVDKSIRAVTDMKPAQMRFPSGASFAELVETELLKLKRREKKTKEVANVEGGNITEPV
jgi:DNA transposition AAA+ family ATPase